MSILTHARTYVHHHTQTVPPYNQTPPTRTRRIHACPPSASPPAQPRTRPRPTHRPPSTPPVHPIDPTHSSPRPCGTHEQTHLCTREHTDAHAHTRTHEYTRVRTRVVSVKAVATAGSVAEHGEEGLPRRGNTIHTLTHLLRLASVALIAPRQRGDQKSAGGGGCFPFQKFKNGGWSSIQTSRAANHCITQRASANRVGTRVCKPGSNPRLHAASRSTSFFAPRPGMISHVAFLIKNNSS